MSDKKRYAIVLLFLICSLLFGCSSPSIAEKDEPVYVEVQTEEAPDITAVSEKTDGQKATATDDMPEQSRTKTYLRSKVNELNVRSAPTASSSRLGLLDAGDMVVFCDEKEGWCHTYYRGRDAFVAAKYVEKVEMETVDEKTEAVIAVGEKLLGTPYVYGAVRLHDGKGNFEKNFNANEYDCSSLMQYMFYYGAGVILRETTRTQVAQGAAVDLTFLRRGDLIFMTNSSRQDKIGVERIGHVAMYLGDNYILHTASDHAVIEEITPARREKFITARRML